MATILKKIHLIISRIFSMLQLPHVTSWDIPWVNKIFFSILKISISFTLFPNLPEVHILFPLNPLVLTFPPFRSEYHEQSGFLSYWISPKLLIADFHSTHQWRQVSCLKSSQSRTIGVPLTSLNQHMLKVKYELKGILNWSLCEQRFLAYILWTNIFVGLVEDLIIFPLRAQSPHSEKACPSHPYKGSDV